MPQNAFRGKEGSIDTSQNSSGGQSSQSPTPFSKFFKWAGINEESSSSFFQTQKTKLPELKISKSESENFALRSASFVSDPSDLIPPAAPLPKEAQEARKKMLEMSGGFSFMETFAPDGFKIYFTGYSTQYGVGAQPKIIWGVAGKDGATVEKTLVYWGKNSVSSPHSGAYASSSLVYQGIAPQNFEYAFQLESGIYYLRALARINGKDYWSDEIKIAVLE